jgi:beta-lactamase regulating signal transducer with metallopeptidase domain
MTILLFAAGLSLFSLILTIVYWIFEQANTDHRQRLRFLKLGILLIVLTIPFTFILHSLSRSHAVGTLLPDSILLVNGLAKAKALAFANRESSRLPEIFAGVYLFGVFLTLTSLVISFFRSKRLLGESTAVEIDGHTVFMSEHAHGPLSFGFIRPKIYIPTGLLQKNDQKAISLALVHEEIHILNHDHRWKLASLLSRAILFFAPTMSYLHRKLELEMEIECDRSTMQRTGATVQEYGSLLIGFADAMSERPPYSVFAYMSDSTLRRRIVAMKTRMVHRPVLAFTMGFAVLMIAAGTTVAASGANKLTNQFEVKTEILIGGKVVSSPQFVVIPNGPASLEMKSENPEAALRMMLTAQDSTDPQLPDGIHLKMAIDYKGQGRAIRANPQVVVLSGKEALITLGFNSDETVEMRILAKRQ